MSWRAEWPDRWASGINKGERKCKLLPTQLKLRGTTRQHTSGSCRPACIVRSARFSYSSTAMPSLGPTGVAADTASPGHPLMLSPIPDKLGDEHGRFCTPPGVQSPWHASPQARNPRRAHGVCCSSLALRRTKGFSGGSILALIPESWVARNVPGTRGAVALVICGLTAEGNRSRWTSPRPWVCRVGVLSSLLDTE